MDKLWYYTIGGKNQHGPVSEDELRAKIQSGEIRASELIWSEGMPEWKTVGSEPAFQPNIQQPVASLSAAPSVSAAIVPPFGGWLAFVGIFNILSGAMMVLTCFGTPAGILMILAGVSAMGAKTALDQIRDIPAEFSPVLAKFRMFFIYSGIIVILNLAIMLLVVLSMGGGFIAALSQFASQFPQ